MEVIKKENDFLAQVFYDKVAYFFVKKIEKKNITPNNLTLFGLFLDLIAAYFFFQGEWVSLIIGGAIIQISLIVDRADGQLARAKNLRSKYGQLLDEGLGVFGMSIVFLAAIGGYFTRTGSVWVWYLGFFALLGLLMMNLFSHLSKKIYGKDNKAGQELRDRLSKKLKTKTHPRLFAFSSDVQRGVMSLSGFINFIPLFLWIFAIIGNAYWVARFYVYRKNDTKKAF